MQGGEVLRDVDGFQSTHLHKVRLRRIQSALDDQLFQSTHLREVRRHMVENYCWSIIACIALRSSIFLRFLVYAFAPRFSSILGINLSCESSKDFMFTYPSHLFIGAFLFVAALY